MTIHPAPRATRTGAPTPSPKDAIAHAGAPAALVSESEPPSTYLFTLLGYDELAQEDDGAIGLSPPEGYHLESWKVADEAVVVCWERNDA